MIKPKLQPDIFQVPSILIIVSPTQKRTRIYAFVILEIIMKMLEFFTLDATK